MLQEYFGETQANQPTSFDLISELQKKICAGVSQGTVIFVHCATSEK